MTVPGWGVRAGPALAAVLRVGPRSARYKAVMDMGQLLLDLNQAGDPPVSPALCACGSDAL